MTDKLMNPAMQWLTIATRRQVVRRAVLIAIVVGSVLNLINHGDALVNLEVDSTSAVKMGLTFLVPYGVSTISSVAAMCETAPDWHRPVCVGENSSLSSESGAK